MGIRYDPYTGLPANEEVRVRAPGLLPKQVRVGAINYQVEIYQDADLEKILKSPLIGACWYRLAKIGVAAGTSEQVLPAVLIHELIHAILDQAGVTKQDEQMVIALSYGLVQMLQDNPELVEYVVVKR